MSDDLFQASMAGTQRVPANFKGDDADNFEEVCASKGTKVARRLT